MYKRLLLGAAAAGLGLAISASPAAADHEGSVYFATLDELNDSGATGDAVITVSEDGETMSVELVAEGFNLDGPHAMHLHGIVEDGEVLASTCPTSADDANGDGVLTVLEGAPRYGAVQVSLTTEGDTSADSALAVERFPAGTSIDFSRSGIEIPDELKPGLSKLHFVVHGIDENGNGTLDLDQTERSSLTDDLPREGTAPALCGTLTVLSEGEIQTGAGGAVEDGQPVAALAIAGVSAAGIAGLAGLTARRRLAGERVSR
jgi:hypothetical protein